MVDLFAQMVVNGIISGSLYLMLGVSWGLIYSTTGTFHFAHALVMVAAGYAASLVAMNLALPLVVAIAAAIAAAVLVGWAIELVVYHPLRKSGATQFIVFIASLGVLILGQNLAQLAFGTNPRNVRGFPVTPIEIGPVTFTSQHVIEVALSVLVMLALWMYLTRTSSGTAIRAVSSNPQMAEIIGVDVRKVYLTVFALGSAIAGLAAVLIAMEGIVSPTMGMAPLFSAFVVTFLGGIGSLAGIVAGGLLLGLSENVALVWIEPQWKVIVSFVVLLAVIILRPMGLFGRAK